MGNIVVIVVVVDVVFASLNVESSVGIIDDSICERFRNSEQLEGE